VVTAAAGVGRREAILRRLGIEPPVAQLVRAALDAAIARAEAAARTAGRGAPGGPPVLVALDAGCGRSSALARHRARIARLVGVDVHSPATGAMPYLDAFVAADVCTDRGAFEAASFDLVLSSFTAEHLADPPAAFRAFAAWLRPGGTLVLTTVNRRHPFVATYLGLPRRLRGRLQRVVKASAADAHPLVGACNDPAALRAALDAAGFTGVHVETTGHLARAWGRRRLTFALGLAGDLLARGLPSRRSTLVVTARSAAAGSASGAQPS
jgi:SAM-dependent methyltransferase